LVAAAGASDSSVAQAALETLCSIYRQPVFRFVLIPALFYDQRFFGDYELPGELGRGGSAIVFKARQFGVNRIVALKLLAGGPAVGRDFIHVITQGAKAALSDIEVLSALTRH